MYISSVVIEDFTGNRYPEIVLANHTIMTMFDRNGLIVWSRAISDSSGAAAPAAFNFNLDGRPEIVYSDEHYLYIIRGIDGAILDKVPHLSLTGFENPVIADIDNDQVADIVVVSSGVRFEHGEGVTAYSDPAWPDTRPIWNQYNYRITNVLDLGEIPVTEPHQWLLYNNCRTQYSNLPDVPVPVTKHHVALLALLAIVPLIVLINSTRKW
jgi:hypothetical protein